MMKLRARFLLLTLSLTIFFTVHISAKTSSSVGEKIPNFKLKNIEDKNIKLHKVIEGKIAVINFTTTWCSDCKKLKKVLKPIIPEYKEKGVEFCYIYIGKGQKKRVLQEMKKGNRNNGVTKLFDENRQAAIRMKITKIPHLYIVDKKGIIRYEGLCLEKKGITEEIEKVLKMGGSEWGS